MSDYNMCSNCGHARDEHGKGTEDGCYTRDCECKEFEPEAAMVASANAALCCDGACRYADIDQFVIDPNCSTHGLGAHQLPPDHP